MRVAVGVSLGIVHADVGFIEIRCDGLTSLDGLWLSAPLDISPAFDTGQLHYDIVGSVLTQSGVFVPVSPVYSEDATFAVALDGTPITAASTDVFPCTFLGPCYGPFDLGSAAHELTAAVDAGPEFAPRSYTFSIDAEAGPREYAFGKGDFVGSAAHLGSPWQQTSATSQWRSRRASSAR